MGKAVPVENIPSSDLENIAGSVAQSAPGVDLSVMQMFIDADVVVKFVILILLASSFWSWAIIYSKFISFRVLNRRMKKFEKKIWSGKPLEEQYNNLKDNSNNPLSTVFVAGMYEWMEWKEKKFEQGNNSQEKFNNLRLSIKDRIFRTMDMTRNKEIGYLEKHLSFLATVGSTAPFIGLFGTVWGIMNSFQSIAMTKNTSLAVVAPGIAEALFATAIGLFAAIPAVIFYNKYSTNVGDIADRIDDFSDEFASVISRELEE